MKWMVNVDEGCDVQRRPMDMMKAPPLIKNSAAYVGIELKRNLKKSQPLAQSNLFPFSSKPSPFKNRLQMLRQTIPFFLISSSLGVWNLGFGIQNLMKYRFQFPRFLFHSHRISSSASLVCLHFSGF